MSETKVLTSSHSIKESNVGKIANLSMFIDEYRRVASIIMDDVWNNGYLFQLIDKDGNTINKEFNISKNLLESPSFLDYNRFGVETFLTARALSSLVTQLCAMLSASTEKQRKRLYMLGKLKDENASKKRRKLLGRKLKQNIPQKPRTNNINLELSSKCIEWVETEGRFNGFLRLKSIMTDKTEINLPIKFTKHTRKMMSMGGTLMNSFHITKSKVDTRWKIPLPDKKSVGTTVGSDQGIKTVLTLSDGQATPSTCIHGHSLESIMHGMERRRKGSKAMKRSQRHRTNHINWMLNQLDLTDVKELRLEEIYNIGFRNKRSRYMSHFTNTIIRDKVESLAEQNGVRFVLQDSTYRSQRCSSCGVVRKANRKGKTYTCKHCGLIIDADFNASKNHEIDLPDVPYELRKKKLNRGNGFLWNPNGFFDFLTGRSLESLPPVEDNSLCNICI